MATVVGKASRWTVRPWVGSWCVFFPVQPTAARSPPLTKPLAGSSCQRFLWRLKPEMLRSHKNLLLFLPGADGSSCQSQEAVPHRSVLPDLGPGAPHVGVGDGLRLRLPPLLRISGGFGLAVSRLAKAAEANGANEEPLRPNSRSQKTACSTAGSFMKIPFTPP